MCRGLPRLYGWSVKKSAGSFVVVPWGAVIVTDALAAFVGVPLIAPELLSSVKPSGKPSADHSTVVSLVAERLYLNTIAGSRRTAVHQNKMDSTGNLDTAIEGLICFKHIQPFSQNSEYAWGDNLGIITDTSCFPLSVLVIPIGHSLGQRVYHPVKAVKQAVKKLRAGDGGLLARPSGPRRPHWPLAAFHKPRPAPPASWPAILPKWAGRRSAPAPLGVSARALDGGTGWVSLLRHSSWFSVILRIAYISQT